MALSIGPIRNEHDYEAALEEIDRLHRNEVAGILRALGWHQEVCGAPRRLKPRESTLHCGHGHEARVPNRGGPRGVLGSWFESRARP
jgi:hypothetical protein